MSSESLVRHFSLKLRDILTNDKDPQGKTYAHGSTTDIQSVQNVGLM
jgi:hypothetical protein